jgi:hypothetical protein
MYTYIAYILPHTHPFIKYLLSTYSMPGTILVTGMHVRTEPRSESLK